MSILQAHRQRVATLQQAMARLGEMHDRAYTVWDRIVRLAESDDPERYEQLENLHDEAYLIADGIARLREEAFGSISREAHLLLTSTVESAHPAIVNPERVPGPGE